MSDYSIRVEPAPNGTWTAYVRHIETGRCAVTLINCADELVAYRHAEEARDHQVLKDATMRRRGVPELWPTRAEDFEQPSLTRFMREAGEVWDD